MKENNFIKYTISYNYRNNKITIDKINDYYENICESIINMNKLNPSLFDEMYRFVQYLQSGNGDYCINIYNVDEIEYALSLIMQSYEVN